ncbi:hypothetical protein IAU59_005014 [Kwoniella sp. CBS 9459]
MDFIAEQFLPYLPPDLQALYHHPPNLSSPGSLIPVIRVLFPYVKWVVVLLAAYIVWSFVIGIFGYFSRFLRFMTRIGPILGLVAWLMANSGQGSMDELFGLVKQWVGLDNAAGAGAGAGGGQAPGIAALAGLFGGNNNNNNQNTRNGYRSKSKTDPISARTRAKKGKAGAGDDSTADFVSSLLNSAASSVGNGNGNGNGNLGDVVQDYVKDSLAKAAGLDWLFGSGSGAAADKKEEKKGWKTR